MLRTIPGLGDGVDKSRWEATIWQVDLLSAWE